MKHGLLLSASLAVLTAAACGNTIVVGTGSDSTGGHQARAPRGAPSGTSASSGGGGELGSGGAGTGGRRASDVTGTVIYTYFGEGMPVTQPASLVGLQIEAYVWGGSSWTTFPGTGTANGTFTVPAVPAGLFMLNVAGSYVYTTAHKLDLGSEVLGRPTAVYGMASNVVGGVVQNLDPWQSTDLDRVVRRQRRRRRLHPRAPRRPRARRR